MSRMRRMLLLAGCFCVMGDGSAFAANGTLEERGEASLTVVRKYLRPAGSACYLQEVRPDGKGRPKPAFNWAMGIQLSALNAAARADRDKYLTEVEECVGVIDQYWIQANGIGGYDSTFRPTKADRYYDDNAWIVLQLIETYELTRQEKYLDRAVKAAAFVFSGEDAVLGGGIYWREREKRSKNTCSNGPAVVCALRLLETTGDRKYEAIARRVYAWTNANLQDPEDALFWDKKTLSGRVDRTKWSYNAALMIRANCSFYDLTKERKYLEEARRIARGAVERWYDDDGRLTDPSYFGHLLTEALLELGKRDGDPKWEKVVRSVAAFVWGKNRDTAGAHPERWDDEVDEKRVEEVELMPQASAARLFFGLAAFEKGGRGD